MKSAVIGWALTCDIRVDDPYASPEHCRVVRADDGTLWVADLGSTNGTFLSGRYAAGPRVFGTLPDLRVRGGPEPWRPGMTLWVGRSGLELDARGWVRAVSK